MICSFNGTVVGIYIGALVDVGSSISALSGATSSSIELTEASRGIIQVCGGNRTSDYTIGLVSSGDSNLVFVQQAVKSWAKASCASTAGASGAKAIDLLGVQTRLVDPQNSRYRRHSHHHSHSHSHSHLFNRATCRTTRVSSGDSCASLATKCGTSPSGFTKNNSYNKKLCSTLMEGQVVCCSAGSLPDIRPKPKANGECATHDVDVRYDLLHTGVRIS